MSPLAPRAPGETPVGPFRVGKLEALRPTDCAIPLSRHHGLVERQPGGLAQARSAEAVASVVVPAETAAPHGQAHGSRWVPQGLSLEESESLVHQSYACFRTSFVARIRALMYGS